MRCRGIGVIFAGIFAISVGATAAAAGDADAKTRDSLIAVNGNRHIGADVIRSHFHGAPEGWFSAVELDAALKSLYATGLFKDVKFSRAGERVVVTVVENPTIERIVFEGNKKLKDDDIKKALHSTANGPLWRPFVQGDVVQITELYRQSSYYDVKVVPKTIARGNARVDLVFEIKEGDRLAVRQVQFIGNTAFSEAKLKAAIKTGATNFLSFILDNDTYDADRIDNDRDLIRRFYRAHGYADVRVTPSSSYQADKNGVVVTFKLDEGPQYRLGTIAIESSIKTVDTAALRPVLHTRSGDIFDADAVDKSVEDLALELAKSGEPFATVAARNERQRPRTGAGGTAVINLSYSVEPGKRLYVERIDIHGNIKTRDDVIRREFDLGEGDAYNRALLDRAERRLKALGYFKSVKLTAEPGSAPDRVVLDVAVEEQQTGNFFISGGYSTSDGWLASINVSDKNFMGTGDIAKASVTYGQYARGFDVSFTDPQVLGQRLAAGVGLFGKQTFANDNQAFNTSLYGAKFTAGTPLTDNLGVTWNYSIYNQGVSLDPAIGTASLPIQLAAAQGLYWVSSIGNSVTYSTLDNAKNPTSGVRAQVNNEFAGLGGAANFAKTTDDVRAYAPIAGDVVGMVRAQGGYVAPWGGQQLPLLDGFFGGPQLVRGFAPNGFGPRDITPGTTMDNLGGNIYWATSAELQAPMPLVSPDAQLKVALFSDTGSLWATGASSVASLSSSLTPAQEIANSKAIRSSLGVGVIWDSMFGPIRVDYAYPIAKQPYDVTQRFQFSAGGF